MNKNGFLKRIAALKGLTNGKLIVFTMPNGSKRLLERSRFRDVCEEAIQGRTSHETEMILSSVADSSGSQLTSLLKMVM